MISEQIVIIAPFITYLISNTLLFKTCLRHGIPRVTITQLTCLPGKTF